MNSDIWDPTPGIQLQIIHKIARKIKTVSLSSLIKLRFMSCVAEPVSFGVLGWDPAPTDRRGRTEVREEAW